MIDVERVDFVSVPTRDNAQARRFYGELLGLEESTTPDDVFVEFETSNLTLGTWQPEEAGRPFVPTSGLALRVPDVEAARRELEAAGVEFHGETMDTGVCHMALLHRLRRERRHPAPPLRGAPPARDGAHGEPRARGRAEASVRMSRAELLERYRALPLPDTNDEHWRFTDLRGFDPDSFAVDGAGVEAAGETMLEIDAAAVVSVTESGIHIDGAVDGVEVVPLEDHELLGTLVGADEKFAAHNAAMWENGLLVRVARGVVVERPIYVRITNSADGGGLFWRLLVDCGPESRLTLVEESTSASPEVAGYSNAVAELFVGQAATFEYVSIQNLSPQTWHFANHHARLERDAELDWVAGGFGSKKGKTRIQNDLAGPGATSRVTGAYFADGSQHLDYDTFQEHISPNTTSDFAFKGALRDRATSVWRGMIRVEPDAQKTNAYQENRNLLLSDKAHADSIPGLEIMANDVRCTHGATIGQVDREQLFYLMARGLSRAEAERLIVRGFFADILDRIELEPVREALGAVLEARIPQA